MLKTAKRNSHIDPPASSYAIMRRARPYRGENPEPGKDVHGELDPTPGIRERDSHIDPPASSYAIMRRARPYRGENPEPGKDVTESLTPRPELENAIHTLIHQRHLTPSCGGPVPTAERTLNPARMSRRA